MQLVTAPLPRMPHACAVTGRDDGELVDFQVEMKAHEPHLYLRTGVIEEAGRLIGMVPKAELDELQRQLARYGAQLEAMQAEAEDLKEFRAAYEKLAARYAPQEA